MHFVGGAIHWLNQGLQPTEIPEDHPSYDEQICQSSVRSFIDPRDQAPSPCFYGEGPGHRNRPTITELRTCNRLAIPFQAPQNQDEREVLRTFMGVFIPLIVNTLGTVFWTKIGEMVGTSGVFGSLIITTFNFLVCLITFSSMSALASNGSMEGGGAYYLISRTVGPQIGRALGIFLAIANSMNPAAASLAFAENLVNYYTLGNPENTITDKAFHDVQLISACVILIVFATRPILNPLRKVTACVSLVAAIFIWVSVFVRDTGSVDGFVAPSIAQLKKNIYPQPMTYSTFFTWVATFTPSYSSMMGAYALQEKLKRPGKMISRGLFSALTVGYLGYSVTVILLALCGEPEYLRTSHVTPLGTFALWPPILFITIGFITAQRAMNGLATGPRVLMKMSNEKLLPNIRFAWNEIVCVLIALICTSTGNMTIIIRINSVFFFVLYTCINASVFMVEVSHTPSWRPSFRWNNRWVSLIGALCSLMLSFITHWIAAVCAWIFMVILFFYSFALHKDTGNNWGGLDQSVTYIRALSHALQLRHVHPHPKLFTLRLLTITDKDNKDGDPFFAFIDSMLDKNCFCIATRVATNAETIQAAIQERKKYEVMMAKEHSMFSEVVLADSLELGLEKQLLLAGLGNLRPNTVCVLIDDYIPEDLYSLVTNTLSCHLGIIAVRNPKEWKGVGNIDVYINYDQMSSDGGLTLLVPYMFMTKNTHMRIMNVEGALKDEEEGRRKLEELIEVFRFDAEVVSNLEVKRDIQTQEIMTGTWSQTGMKATDPLTQKYLCIAQLLSTYSTDAAMVAVSLPIPKQQEGPLNEEEIKIWRQLLDELSCVNCPICLIHGNGAQVLSDHV